MLPIVGLALIAVALRDVVHKLFHPELAGSISRFLCDRTWRLLRLLGRVHRGVRHNAGPLILIAVGATWLALVAIAAALIYMPQLPQGFDINRGAGGLEAVARDHLIDGRLLPPDRRVRHEAT